MKSQYKAMAVFLTLMMLISCLPSSYVAASPLSESVIYNLGSQEVTVGYDYAKASSAPWSYKLFEKNGSYTIRLEDNAFFPYEVQFKVNGAASALWFENQESTVAVGGHTFSVYSEYNDDTKLSQIGVWIDGKYVAARPSSKVFANPKIMPLSLLPITERRVNVDLSEFMPDELDAVTLSTLFSYSSGEITAGAAAVYARGLWEDEFVVLTDENAVLNLSGQFPETKQLAIQLIVGTISQLNYANVRYIVTISLPTYEDLFDFTVCDYPSGEQLEIDEVYYSSSWSAEREEWIPQYILEIKENEDPDLPGEFIRTEFQPSADYQSMNINVYEGFYDTPEEAAGKSPVVDDITYREVVVSLTAFITKDNITRIFRFQIRLSLFPGALEGNDPILSFFNIAYQNTAGLRDTGISTEIVNPEISYIPEIELYLELYEQYPELFPEGLSEMIPFFTTTVVAKLQPGYSASDAYYLGLRCLKGDVKKAVTGHFLTEADALSMPDIKDQLFPATMSQVDAGYNAVYENGMDFTVFTIGDDYQTYTFLLTIEVTDQPIDYSRPIVGSTDTYFRLNGATGYPNAYILSYNADSLYANYRGAYQTVLLLDDNADLNSLQPTFWTNPGVKMYAGEEQVSGVTQQNFTGGPVEYTARAMDGRNIKNYFVTYVQAKLGCAELFVNGPDTREVFMDESYEPHHDIFIANLGSEPLTGLKAEWLGVPQNVKIDEYWTVGGPGNDVLAGFSATEKTTDFGEIPNVAKIRLMPTGEGIISGTLKISSDNGGSRVIELTGAAGNPKIITSTVNPAVKYVPYSFMVQTDNMHEWNKVVFSLLPGSVLPMGVSLLPNGELYGVPMETGVFHFSVLASYSYDGFSDSTASLTLTVNANTSGNVDAQNDYTISQRVPDMTSYQDQVFEIDHAFSEWTGKFFIDGEELIEGTHYDATEGSTKMTIRSQTLQDKGPGTHTIAAEFRNDNGTGNVMTKSTQNYTSSVGVSPPVDTTPMTGVIVVVTTIVNGVATGSVTDAQVSNVIDGAKKTNNSVTIKADSKTASTVEIKLSKVALDLIAENNLTLTIDTGALGTISFDTVALKGITAYTGTAIDTVVISLTLMQKTDLTESQQLLIPDKAIIIKCSVSIGGKTVKDFGNGYVVLCIPFLLPDSTKATQIVPYYLDESMNALDLVMGGYNPTLKTLEIKLRHFSIYVLEIKNIQYEAHGGWYNDSLDWAVQRNLLDNYIIDGRINAAQEISRTDFVVALIKALGIQPLTSFTVEQFSDVDNEDAEYIKTARELGIVIGVGDNMFEPYRSAIRGEQFQIVYNLIQAKITVAKNANTGKTISDFKDAKTIPDWLKPALEELLMLGIVTGDGDNLRVADSFTVGTLAVVLQRMANIEAAA